MKSNRDDWVYDFDVRNLRNKALFFADTYNELLDRDDKSYPSVIKWSRDLRNEFRRERRIVYSEANRIQSLFRPFVTKHHFADFTMNDVLTRNHYSMFGADLKQPNQVICFQSTGARRPFAVLATDKVSDFHLFFDGAQCLPLYRYTEDGERVSNITDWGLRRVNERYRREYGDSFEEAVGAEAITAEDIFAYTYAVLHDPVYRHDYAVDLLREFPRLPLYHDFAAWRDMGSALLDLHIGFEDVQPYPLEITSMDRMGRMGLRLGCCCGRTRTRASSGWMSGLRCGACRRMRGGICWGAGRRWSGCWTSTRRRSRGMGLSRLGSMLIGSRITRKR